MTSPVVTAVMAAVRATRWALFPSPWATRWRWTVEAATENPRSARRSAYWREPMVGSTTARVSSSATTGVGVALGGCGVRLALGMSASKP